MRLLWIGMSVILVAITLTLVAWLGSLPESTAASEAPVANDDAQPLRLSLIPERDIFEQRKRYQRLAAYVSRRLDQPVEVLTQNTYEAALSDLETGATDGAFLGSFVSVLAMDRCDARVLARPETPDGITRYRGVLFAREESPIGSTADLAGRSIAMVKATTAGDLFPIAEMKRVGILNSEHAPIIRWVGTHDEVIREVVAGRVDAGAAKDLRLEAFLRENPEAPLRRVCASAAVPTNALLLTPEAERAHGEALRRILLEMSSDEVGRAVLADFGARRFIPCEPAEYEAVYEMVEALGDAWPHLGVSGPPPARSQPISTGAGEGG
jgi:phosphonate transport system substrate-binding protein